MNPTQRQPPETDQVVPRARLIRLGAVLGVPVYVTPSWLLIVVFVTASYAGFLKDQVPGLSTGHSYALALVYALGLGASVLLHEIGHTVVSRALGLSVRRIVVFLLGGISELDGEAGRPRDEFAIAAAGPLVSLLLAGGCWGFSLLAGGRHRHRGAAAPAGLEQPGDRGLQRAAGAAAGRRPAGAVGDLDGQPVPVDRGPDRVLVRPGAGRAAGAWRCCSATPASASTAARYQHLHRHRDGLRAGRLPLVRRRPDAADRRTRRPDGGAAAGSC